jgi:Flp pilus assembly protein TadG
MLILVATKALVQPAVVPTLAKDIVMPKRMKSNLRTDRKGNIAILFAISIFPIMATVGAAIDTTRAWDAQQELQDAVDAATIASASAYTDSTQASLATTIAKQYILGYSLHEGTTIVAGYPAVSFAQETDSSGNSSYNATITVNAVMQNTFMAAFGFSSQALSATATAINPILRPIFKSSHFGASAADWNTVYMYPVPLNSNGQPNYLGIPNSSSLYEIDSNCNSKSINWSSKSPCNSQPGAIVPSNQTMPTLSATQPMAFVLNNVTGGLLVPPNAGKDYKNYGYGSNQYGSEYGGINWFTSAAPMSDTSPDVYTTHFHSNAFGLPTNSVIYPANTNCSLMVEVVDPNNLPTKPPASGQCFANNGSAGGVNYAAITCSAIAGRTLMFWWNDMGGQTDDKDYNDAYYTVSCVAAVGGSGTVVLTQ